MTESLPGTVAKNHDRMVTRRTRLYQPEVEGDERATVFIWHIKIGTDTEDKSVRATHLHIDQDANIFLLDRNAGDAIVFYAPRERVTYVQRYGRVTAPSEG